MARTPDYLKVLRFVLNQHITVERFREGMRTGNRATCELEKETVGALLAFLMEHQGGAVEEAADVLVKHRDECVQAKARNPKDASWIGLFIVGVYLLILGSMGMNVSFWPLVIFLPVALLLVCVLAWKPRKRTMLKVWKGEGTIEEKLASLLEIQSMPLMQMIGEHQRTTAIILAAVAVVSIGGLSIYQGGVDAKLSKYNADMSVLQLDENCQGTRYVVYDEDKGRYVPKYLTAEQMAQTPDEVRCVFRIHLDSHLVGTYEDNAGYAYQYYLEIEMVDQRTGGVVDRETVMGGDPPRSISVKEGTRGRKAYGSKPDADEIADAMTRMISQFERIMREMGN